ncbi:hypothetical protein CWD78_19705 [Dickeya dadantii]|nr:hypothetical protein [Dickeya dadantii]
MLLAILDLGSARNPHVLRVRSGLLAALARWAGQSALSVQHALHVVCALSVSKLAAPITLGGPGSYSASLYLNLIKSRRSFLSGRRSG